MASSRELADAVRNAARESDGRPVLPCAEAFRLAAAFGVAPVEVGYLCNELKIKISQCQLGCFK